MLRTIAAAAIACLCATAAHAADPVRISAACKTESASFCQADPKAEGKVQGRLACLEQNESKLSPACVAAVKASREAREKVRTAYKADRARLCSDTKGAAALQCLRAKQAELTKPCAEALAALPQRAAKN
jgi:hypothetical protein